MLRFLVPVLLMLPVIDIYVLIQIASSIGFWQTVVIILATGIAGAEILRREGRHVFRKLQRSVTAGEMSRNVLEGAMLVVSGAFLLTPGVVTDILGVLLAFRPLRERAVARLMNAREFSSFEFEVQSF